MNQNKRILFGLAALALIVLLVFAVDALRRSPTLSGAGAAAPAGTLAPGSVPIYLEGALVAGFAPDGLAELEQVSFVDAEEGKTQQGWLLRDVLLLYIDADQLNPTSLVTVSSSSREKSVQLTWAEIDAAENMVMFDLANKGTLKLVSTLEGFDTREAWVQDVDRIEVKQP